MDLCRLIYVSTASRPFGDAELRSLVERSRERNHARGLSGLLLYEGGHFLQVLEGNPMRVATLFRQIGADDRHINVRELSRHRVDSRLFADWGMNLATTGELRPFDQSRIDRVLMRIRLQPRPDDTTDALALLAEFRDQLVRRCA